MKRYIKRILSVIGVILCSLAVTVVGYGSEGVTSKDSIVVSSGTSSEPAAYPAAPVDVDENIFMNFASLKEQNADVYAWIMIPGTMDGLPVVQRSSAEDPYDDFYLNHTIDLVEGYPGAIYSQPINSIDFTDPVTVLYGHNMKDGSMFGCLHEFEDKNYFDKGHNVIIYTPQYMLVYEIFSAIHFSDALITYEYDFSDQTGIQMYLNDIMGSKGNFNNGVTVTADDKILTLSTCFSNRDSERLLIEAVLIEKREAPTEPEH